MQTHLSCHLLSSLKHLYLCVCYIPWTLMLFQASRWQRHFAYYIVLYIFIRNNFVCPFWLTISAHLSPSLIPSIVRLNEIIRKIYSFLWCTSYCCVYLCKPTIIPAFRQIVSVYIIFCWLSPFIHLCLLIFFHIFFVSISFIALDPLLHTIWPPSIELFGFSSSFA